ncbi:MAG TPA: flagellar basal body rod C-terminal domain-containing protein [Gammaproteobacteria bacterium]|nr:flagellar basal body rod C-terminal domain-containing protein [Gammaproteobacteria bacterium]
MDKISGVLQTALGGIDRASHKLRAAAREVASAPVHRSEPTELVDPLVHALEAQRAFEASASVVRRTDEMLGTLLDTFV